MTKSAPHTPDRMSVSIPGWRIVWHGGEYAEIFPVGHSVGVDVFNLWDHEHDRPQQDYTRADLRAMLKQWTKDNADILNDYILGAR